MLKSYFVLFFVALFMLAGCFGEKEAVLQPIEEEPSLEEDVLPVEEEEEEEEPKYQFPLTGIETEAEPLDRPVAVMINNHPSARPQSGIEKADIVYEVLAEGSVTRLLAIFASEKPEMIGPVRSARDYYIELAAGYDSLYIAHGYSPSAKQLLDSGYIDHLNGIRYDGILFERVNFKRAPHNSYIRFENIIKGAEDNSFKLNDHPRPLTFLDESELGNLSGSKVDEINIVYGTQSFDVQYVYDQTVQQYRRYGGGIETTDTETEQPVLIDNIFIVEMDHRILDNEGRRAIDLTSGGRGYLMQQGIMNEVNWQNVEGRILPFQNGDLLEFVPGKTWINIVPSLDRVTR